VRRICAPGAMLEVVLGLDPSRDRSEIERLGLTQISLEFVDRVLVPRYASAGFEITERGMRPASECAEFNTSWAKRLQGNENRPVTYFIAGAVQNRR
ncbi:MAG TPA: hypothetical protein VJM12_09510, partial [Pyrinomonadaceae bacterium]|nr:hypothetical protein [Pyrinomonadaceae bacterium]